MLRDEIIAALERDLPLACEGMDVVAVYLYGSVAREEGREDSDVDVGVFLRGDEGVPSRWPPAEIVIEERLSRITGLPVEVHVLNDAPLELSGRVLEEGVLVFSGDEVARVRLEVAVRGQYLDFKPRLEQLHKARLAAFAERGLR